jgi:hypothetical protein
MLMAALRKAIDLSYERALADPVLRWPLALNLTLQHLPPTQAERHHAVKAGPAKAPLPQRCALLSSLHGSTPSTSSAKRSTFSTRLQT